VWRVAATGCDKKSTAQTSDGVTDVTEPLLKISHLKTAFFTGEGVIRAVDGVDLAIGEGETVGVVGESGSGKSVTAYSILHLVPFPGRVVEGEILFRGEDLLKRSPGAMQAIRGNRISMIFQEPMTSLNPVHPIGRQVMEPLIYHRTLSKKAARKEAIHLLQLVGIPSAERRINEYPHQLSGGMRQRVMIAMALACRPELLIADEPTTALDVTIQAQILTLMKQLQREFGMAIMLITHNLGVVAQTVDHVVVMYGGQAVELGRVEAIFDHPIHPYTIGLLGSIPKLNERRDMLQDIKGTVPSPKQYPAGCRFHPRCPRIMEVCRTDLPSLLEVEAGHMVRCWDVSAKRA
jgi:oligopeptide/dipeptide ABC transporter ATP-binding protein